MIRDVAVADAHQIANIYNHFVETSTATFETDPLSSALLAERMETITSDGYPYLVYERDGQVLGYAYGSRWKTRAAYAHTVEISIYLHSDRQGTGVGTTLYEALFQRLELGDYHAVIAVIALPNLPSIKLHEKFGFTKVAHFAEVGQKFGTWIDVGYWQRPLKA